MSSQIYSPPPPSGGEVEKSLLQLSVGTLILFALVLGAFVWVERKLASNLALNEEVVTPARTTAESLESTVGALLADESQLLAARSLAEAQGVGTERDSHLSELSQIRSDLGRVVQGLMTGEDGLGSDYPARVRTSLDGLVAADGSFREAHLERLGLAENLDAAIASVEKDLNQFLQTASGISGKMQFEYGSSLRRIRWQLQKEGWSPRVRATIERDVLTSSSLRNMLVGDVLALASEMNRLAGKIGLVRNRDQLRSLLVNDLSITRDRLEAALEELHLEVKEDSGLGGTVTQLEEALTALDAKVLSTDTPESLIALKTRLLDAEARGHQLQDELGQIARQASQLTAELVAAAETQSQSFSSQLAAASSATRWLLAIAVLLAVGGGVVGARQVRGSLKELRATNADLVALRDELTAFNQALEGKVAERTAALDNRNQAMRVVLDNVEQGLATLDRDAHVEGERSAQFDQWFGQRVSGQPFHEILKRFSDHAATFFELGWDEVMEGIMPLELTLAQLPQRLTIGDRTLAFEYNPIEMGPDEVPERVLLIVSDITEQVERERAEIVEREFMQVFKHLMKDRASFVDFFEEAESTVRKLAAPDDSPELEGQALFRAVHTLKGNCALFGIEQMAGFCHELETKLAEERRGPNDAERQQVQRTWAETSDRLRPLLGQGEDNTLSVRTAELDELLDEARTLELPAPFVAQLDSWRHEPSAGRLDRMAEQARALAHRIGKGDIEVVSTGGEVRLPRQPLSPLWASLAHVIRNAVDHGIEAPDVRASSGKESRGRLELSVVEDTDTVTISVTDDGAGINWDALAAKAKAAGLPHVGHDALVTVLFTDGITSKEKVTTTSGRGVGMSAVRAAASRLGARIRVTSAAGEGATFNFVIPRHRLMGGAHPNVPSFTGTLDLSPPPA